MCFALLSFTSYWLGFAYTHKTSQKTHNITHTTSQQHTQHHNNKAITDMHKAEQSKTYTQEMISPKNTNCSQFDPSLSFRWQAPVEGGEGGKGAPPSPPQYPLDPGPQYQPRGWGGGVDDFLTSSPLSMDTNTDTYVYNSDKLNWEKHRSSGKLHLFI